MDLPGIRNRFFNYKFFYQKVFSHRFRFWVPLIWIPSSIFSVIVLISLVLLTTFKANTAELKYSTYSAKPYVLGSSTTAIAVDDAKAETIDAVFKKFNCPIADYGQKFVAEAEKNNIPHWVVAAIAFHESSCGKAVPKVNGVSSNNLWGWGVYGKNTHMFESVDEGIETVSKYMNDKFYSKEITDLCDIMKIYTPPSKGSWCQGVEFFKEEIINFESS